MIRQLTAFKTTEYETLGSTFFDSIAHAELFRSNNVHQFGVMTSQLFSTTNNLGITNKRWIYMTEAQGNYRELPPGMDDYSWVNAGDLSTDIRIVKKFVSSSEQVGKNNLSFRVGVDKPWYGEPAQLKTENDNAPLLSIVGQPYAEGSYYVIEVKLQDGRSDVWIDDKYFDVGRTLVQGGSKVSIEQNGKYRNIGPWGDAVKLRSHVGQVAAEIEFSDRFLKLEAAARSAGNKYTSVDGNRYSDAFSRGHIYYANLGVPGSKKKVQKGFFLGVAEERLLEAVEYDCNFMMEFGHNEITLDEESKRSIKVAPGWRQLYKDGQYFTHSGYFTLQWLVDKLHMVMFRKRRFKNRKPMLVGGTGAITFVSQLISENAVFTNSTEPGFAIKKTSNPTGVHENEYAYGFQFTEFMAPMGVKVQIMYDPAKDDPTIYKEKAPGSYLPLESFQIDILDFGETEDAMENGRQDNITMIKQSMGDYYFSIANAYQRTGPVNDGSNVYEFGKDLSIKREKSGSLGVWDTWVIGRVEWVVA